MSKRNETPPPVVVETPAVVEDKSNPTDLIIMPPPAQAPPAQAQFEEEDEVKPFTEVFDVRKWKEYELTRADLLVFERNMNEIIGAFRGMIPNIFVKHNLTIAGHYLNIYNGKPKNAYADAIAHISFHSDNMRYHFKITKPELMVPPLPYPPNNTTYTIPFKIYKHRKSYTIRPVKIHNPNTETECPDEIMETFQFVLDKIKYILNNVGGITTRRKRINKKQKSRRRFVRRSTTTTTRRERINKKQKSRKFIKR